MAISHSASAKLARAARDEEIFLKWGRGVSAAKLAEHYGLTDARIFQIIAKARADDAAGAAVRQSSSV